MSFPRLLFCSLVLIGWSDRQACAKIGGWDTAPNTQYHIQTDEGPERFFRYQTISGQYRKEKRLQDGSVVGTYGWVDANGYLRLRDYIADDKGYRIVRTKMVRVGQEEPSTTTTTTPRPPPIALSDYLKEKQSEDYRAPSVEIVPNGYPSSTPSPVNSYIQPTTYRPYLYNLNSLDQKPYESQQQLVQQQVLAVQQQVQAAQQQQFQDAQQQLQAARQQQAQPSQQEVPYDGVSFTQNGFRYYLPRHYHEEETAGDRRAGSFGYIDPFGIRRVIYYNTDPSSGFVHRKNNRYVGFNATPYDPRY